jgi:TonB family protein
MRTIARVTWPLLILFSGTTPSWSQKTRPSLESPTGAAVESELDGWKRFSSTEGGFEVLFPAGPKKSSGRVKVGSLAAETYSYTVRAGDSYSVMYFDVPHVVSDAQLTQDLLFGLRNFVLAELKGKILSDRPISVDDSLGRLLEISITNGDVARVLIIVSGQRIYRVMAIPQQGLVPDGRKFTSTSVAYLKSFRAIPVDKLPEGEVDKFLRAEPEPGRAALKSPLVSRGVLNGEALGLPHPEYPAIARIAHASGTVVVRVVIDEEGKVIAAQAMSGHPLLRPVAVKAARDARFSPTLQEGKPVKVLGVLTYNFVQR